jgi:hypothetical protein
MPASTWSSLAGSAAAISPSAVCTALAQLLAGDSTQVSITLLNPTSLPPTVMDTSVVAVLSADSWVLITEAVVAPEQVSAV